MARLFVSDIIEVGRTIRASVSATAAPCDPVRWDATAPCREFYFTPTTPGVLQIEIKWDGQPELDATIVTPADDYVTSSITAGSNRITGIPRIVGLSSVYRTNAFVVSASQLALSPCPTRGANA